MDKDICSWFNVLDNKTSSNTDFLSWMKQQQQTTCSTGPKVSIMAAPHHHHQQSNPDRLFCHEDDDGGGATAAAAVGSTNKSGGAFEAGASNIYRHQISSGGGGGGGGIFGYSHGGGGMGRFTAEQWKELERQAMIYKCMISSVPVPPHLLFPSAPLLYGGGGGRYSRKGSDPEPGRCKRTDGKKWRCSREVAPLQKYCDRHLHRGRPRSRKPVELNNNMSAPNQKKTRTKSPPPLPLPLPLFKPKTHLTISPPYLNATNRDLGVMKQPWQDPIPIEAAEMGLGMASDYRSSFDEDYAPLDLFSYPNFPSQSQEMNLAAGFIDAKSSVSMTQGDLSPSLNLSMAMAVGDVLDEQMKNIQTTRAEDIDIDSMWLNPAGWEPFARGGGGPLAEALQSNPASPYNSTSVSSPSGVLHRTLFSHSDGSVCNSPTATFRLIGN